MNNRNSTKCVLCGSDNSRVYRLLGGYTIVRCLNDGLIYVNPQPPLNEYREFYNTDYFARKDRAGQGYRDYLGERDIHQKNCSKILAKIQKARPGKGRILDVGCAFGFFVRCAQEKGWEAFGVDFSDEAAQWAQRELKVKVFTGSTASCGFPDAHFDVVCMIGVIEHLLNPLQELEEASRVLKKDGLLCIITVDFDHIIGRGSLKPPEHLYYFSIATLKKILTKAGFSIYAHESYSTLYSIQDLITRSFHYADKFINNSLLKRAWKQVHTSVNRLAYLLKAQRLPVAFADGQIFMIAKK
ncbi:MAG: class I SAM-dependent methyltransferase [Candidatus Omnitrophica bacterium]|nr:class I SAM-dependent methyltransferase [Candidatus Omnitrophota bacterium]